MGVVRSGPKPTRRHQHESFGDRHESALPDDERAPMARVRLDEAIFQTKPIAQIEAPGLVRDERIGASLQRESVETLGR